MVKIKSGFGRHDKVLAFLAAEVCIRKFDKRFMPGLVCFEEMADLCDSVQDVMDAVKTMRDAKPLHRVSAALDMLRDRRRGERRAAEVHNA